MQAFLLLSLLYACSTLIISLFKIKFRLPWFGNGFSKEAKQPGSWHRSGLCCLLRKSSHRWLAWALIPSSGLYAPFGSCLEILSLRISFLNGLFGSPVAIMKDWRTDGIWAEKDCYVLMLVGASIHSLRTDSVEGRTPGIVAVSVSAVKTLKNQVGRDKT